MLKALMDYAESYLGEAEPGFVPKEVRWAIHVSEDGVRFLDVVPLGDPTQKRSRGRMFKKCANFSHPEMKAGGRPKAHFLVDTADRIVMLGAAEGEEEVRQRFEFHLEMLRGAGRAVPALSRLAELLSDPEELARIQGELGSLGAKPADKATFQIGDAFPADSDLWHAWWREFRRSIKPPPSGNTMVCLISGVPVTPVLTHDTKVKGLARVGGRSMGDVLVGFDKQAFESFGLQQSQNAACSEEAAAAYCAALNDLITAHSRVLAGAMVVHWFKERVADPEDPMPWLEEGLSREQTEIDAQRQARELLAAIEAGFRPDLARNRYYALTLSGNSGRVMVRDWMEGDFKDLLRNIGAWFEDLSVVHRSGDGLARSPKFLAVLGATVRSLDELAAPHVSKLWRVAVRSEAIPLSFLAQALQRAKLDIIRDDPANHARMGLIKAYHLRKDRQKGGNGMSDTQPYLNEAHPSPAYQCGRLLAVLAALQRSALGDVGAGVVQRYYAAASSTPSLVLGRLMRSAQFHLNKLEGGLPHWYERKLGEISARLGDQVPRTLNLEDQSLFALGYYQQLADMRTKKVVPNDDSQEVEEK